MVIIRPENCPDVLKDSKSYRRWHDMIIKKAWLEEVKENSDKLKKITGFSWS